MYLEPAHRQLYDVHCDLLSGTVCPRAYVYEALKIVFVRRTTETSLISRVATNSLFRSVLIFCSIIFANHNRNEEEGESETNEILKS